MNLFAVNVAALLKNCTHRVLPIALLSALLPVQFAIAASQPDIKDIFQSVLACAVIDPFLAEMPVAPLYDQNGPNCEAAAPSSSNQQYYGDDNCEVPVSFTATSLIEHCSLLLNPKTLGEGDDIVSGAWTLSPGSRLDVGAKPLSGVMQPYLQRQIYKTVQTPRGVCELEMRVYKDSPANKNNTSQPALLALHGGSWSARGFGFFGLELTIPHYVQQGFVVYAPFYRLLGESEGSAACNQSDITSIVEDAESALDWVQQNASTYGSNAKPVVFGQSAGAHLATSLLVNRANDVSGAVLLYPPTDFTDFALRAQQGDYTDEQGLGILQRLVGMDAADVDINASPVPENSFPIRIVEQGIEVPPVMMITGMRDTLVEARQSIRLCDALSGDELLAADQEVQAISSLREVIQCGDDGASQVQLIREGQHALDVCFAEFPLATDLCPSGSEESRNEVALAITDALSFALSAAQRPAQADETSSGQATTSASSSGGALGLISLLCLSTLAFRRRWSNLKLSFVTCVLKRIA